MGDLREQVTCTVDATEIRLAQERADSCRMSAQELWEKLDAVGEGLGMYPSVERALRFDADLRAALIARVANTAVTLDARWAALRVAEQTIFAGDRLGATDLYEALLRAATAEERAWVYGRYGWFPGPAALPEVVADLRCPHASTVQAALRTLDRLGADIPLTELMDLEEHADAEVASLSTQIRCRRFPTDDDIRRATRDLLETEDLCVATQQVRHLTAQRCNPKVVSSVADTMLAFCLARLDRASPQVGISSDTWTSPLSSALHHLGRTGQVSAPLEAKLLDLAPRHALRHHGLTASARRLGIAALHTLDESSNGFHIDACAMLEVVAAHHPGDAPLTLQRLRAMDWKLSGYRSAIRTCIKLGTEGRELLRSRLDAFPPTMRASARWELAGHTGLALANRLDALGALEPGWQDRLEPGSATGFDALENALHAGNRAAVFDREIGRIPVGHDGLLVQLAQLTAGAFVPQAALERYLEPDATEAYAVEFIVDKTLYAFHPRDRGDFYDVETVLSAMNFAVCNAGHSERFILLPNSGQMATVVWLDETVARTIADTFDLGLLVPE